MSDVADVHNRHPHNPCNNGKQCGCPSQTYSQNLCLIYQNPHFTDVRRGRLPNPCLIHPMFHIADVRIIPISFTKIHVAADICRGRPPRACLPQPMIHFADVRNGRLHNPCLIYLPLLIAIYYSYLSPFTHCRIPYLPPTNPTTSHLHGRIPYLRPFSFATSLVGRWFDVWCEGIQWFDDSTVKAKVILRWFGDFAVKAWSSLHSPHRRSPKVFIAIAGKIIFFCFF